MDITKQVWGFAEALFKGVGGASDPGQFFTTSADVPVTTPASSTSSVLMAAADGAKSGDGSGSNPMMKIHGFVTSQYKEVQPWASFVHRPSVPKNVGETTSRIWHNGFRFRANYVILMIILSAYSLFVEVGE